MDDRETNLGLSPRTAPTHSLGRLGRVALLGLTLAWLVSAPPAAAAVGWQRLSVADGTEAPLAVAVWYPTGAPARPTRLGPLRQTVAPDAPVAGQDLPLVLISHGNGGSMFSHADTALALAEAGFVVAAPLHTGDNHADQRGATDTLARPRHVRRVLDHLLREWPAHAQLGPERIGVFGFSAGGFTALALLGGRPDFSRVAPYCDAHPGEFTCGLLRRHGAPGATGGANLDAAHEPRLRAGVVAAPSLGFTFGTAGLARVTQPLQLWQAGGDTVLPEPGYADAVRAALPRPPEAHREPNAGHFDFLAPCGDELAQALPAICTSAPGFDRADFHARFNASVVAFFQRTLPAP